MKEQHTLIFNTPFDRRHLPQILSLTEREYLVGFSVTYFYLPVSIMYFVFILPQNSG